MSRRLRPATKQRRGGTPTSSTEGARRKRCCCDPWKGKRVVGGVKGLIFKVGFGFGSSPVVGKVVPLTCGGCEEMWR